MVREEPGFAALLREYGAFIARIAASDEAQPSESSLRRHLRRQQPVMDTASVSDRIDLSIRTRSSTAAVAEPGQCDEHVRALRSRIGIGGRAHPACPSSGAANHRARLFQCLCICNAGRDSDVGATGTPKATAARGHPARFARAGMVSARELASSPSSSRSTT